MQGFRKCVARSRFRSIAWRMPCACFQYGLSISSVKVVRHNEEDFFGGACGKKGENAKCPSNRLGSTKPFTTKDTKDHEGLGWAVRRLVKEYFLIGNRTAATKETAKKLDPSASGAEDRSEKKGFIAALKRCATQNRAQDRVFPQPAREWPRRRAHECDSDPQVRSV